MSKTAAIYARVSKDIQLANYSIPTQLKACHDYASEHGYEVVAEFVDSYTGTEFSRPEFDKLKKLAGKIDALIVYDTDRLSRDAVDMANIHRDFQNKGTEIKFVNFALDTTTVWGQAFLFFQGVYAMEENAKRVERSKRGKRARAKGGKVFITTVAPYGYDYNSETGKLVVNNEQAHVVRQIFNLYVYGDESGKMLGIGSIANWLSERRIPTKHDLAGIKKHYREYGVWSYNSVRKILHNTTYIGAWYYGRNKTGKTRTTRVKTDPSEWITVSVPCILDHDLFQAAQEQAKKNRRQSKRNTKRKYLLQGRLYCPVCKSTFRCRADYRTQEKGLGYYCCAGQEKRHSSDRATVTCHWSLNQEQTEEMVWDAILPLLRDPNSLAEAITYRQTDMEEQTKALKEQLDGCDIELDEIDKKLTKLVDLYLEDSVPKDILESRSLDLKKKQSLYLEKKADLEQCISEIELSPDYENQVQEFCKAVQAGLELFSFEDKFKVIELLDVRGIVHRGKSKDEDVIELTGYIPKVQLNTEEFETIPSVKQG